LRNAENGVGAGILCRAFWSALFFLG